MTPETKFEELLNRIEKKIRELRCDKHEFIFPFSVAEMSPFEQYSVTVHCTKCGRAEVINFNKPKAE